MMETIRWTRSCPRTGGVLYACGQDIDIGQAKSMVPWILTFLLGRRFWFECAYVFVADLEIFLQFGGLLQQSGGNFNILLHHCTILNRVLRFILIDESRTLFFRQPQDQGSGFVQHAEHMAVERSVWVCRSFAFDLRNS